MRSKRLSGSTGRHSSRRRAGEDAAQTTGAGQAVNPGARAPSGDEEIEPAAAPDAPVVVEPALIERIEPVYPPGCETNAAAMETVDIAFTVTPDGLVVSERVTASSNACFDRAALNAVKRWRFSPRMVDGAPRPAFEQQANFRFERPS
ncbi:MAG: energy transducer TonB [Parvularculaceae bacterium]